MSYPRRLGEASVTFTVPIGGGRATGSVSLASLGLDTKIEYVVDVRVDREVPIVDDVYEPSYGINATEDAVGLTVAAGTGTTLTGNVLVLGH